MAEELKIDFSPVIRAVREVREDLNAVNDNLSRVSAQVDGVESNVSVINSRMELLAEEFSAFVLKDSMEKELQRMMTDIIRIRQELEKKYGHYDEVRRRTTGILQAVDISVVRKETIASCTEELMLSAPRYWLAPCLIAMAAWINDDKSLADKAIGEALKRDDEKASLLFALISRRAERLETSEVWLERYFSMQDPMALERGMIVVVDGFASGLFGSDSHGNCSMRIKEWISELSEKVGFVEEQHNQWANALFSKMHGSDNGRYQNLEKYSPTWDKLDKSLTGAKLHRTINDYFQHIFSGVISPSKSLAVAVDDLLDKLVTKFDDEELPLRREERLASLIIEERGNRGLAENRYNLEQVALDERFSFTQLLTNAAMHPETSHASKATQRLAVAMSKDWIIKAYEDITAQNRAQIPVEIQLKIEDWSGITRDGSNENELLESIKLHCNNLQTKALARVGFDLSHWFALAAGIILTFFGITPPFNILIVVFGLAGLAWFGKGYLDLEKKREKVRNDFEKLREQYQGTLKATLAEAADLRREISAEDSNYDNVMQFLEAITPQQFVSSNYGPRMIAGQ